MTESERQRIYGRCEADRQDFMRIARRYPSASLMRMRAIHAARKCNHKAVALWYRHDERDTKGGTNDTKIQGSSAH